MPIQNQSDTARFFQLWASVHSLVPLACHPSLLAINPEQARTYIGDLVDAGFNAFSEH
jgi:hypothetical protein